MLVSHVRALRCRGGWSSCHNATCDADKFLVVATNYIPYHLHVGDDKLIQCITGVPGWRASFSVAALVQPCLVSGIIASSLPSLPVTTLPCWHGVHTPVPRHITRRIVYIAHHSAPPEHLCMQMSGCAACTPRPARVGCSPSAQGCLRSACGWPCSSCSNRKTPAPLSGRGTPRPNVASTDARGTCSA